MLYKLTLVRGLPGAGKSTLAATMNGIVVSADDYFVNNDGVYIFDPAKLKAAHDTCRERCERSLHVSNVVVANTFSMRWEMQPYMRWSPEVIDLFDSGLTDEQLFHRNIHGVPLATISAMRRRWNT